MPFQAAGAVLCVPMYPSSWPGSSASTCGGARGKRVSEERAPWTPRYGHSFLRKSLSLSLALSLATTIQHSV